MSYNKYVKSKKSKNWVKSFLLLGLLVIAGVVVLGAWPKQKFVAIPHRNQVDTQISQHSNRSLPPSIIITDPEFKQITFAANLPKTGIFDGQIAAVAKTIRSFRNLITKKDEPREYGTWVWTPTLQMTPQYVNEILDGAQKDGLNAVYVSIDSYLDIFTMAKGPEREKKKDLFENILENFISAASQRGIAVDAEAGWQNWAEPGNEYKAFAIANFVKNFNETHQHKFRGFQYDVEPYLLTDYPKEKERVLKNFVALIDQTEKFLSDSNLKFSVVLPDFFDGQDGLTPAFAYQNKEDYVFGHILKILDRREGSTVIVMSYRNYASGEDGSIEVTNNEMQTAKTNGHQTKIIVAQETGDVPPPYITFYKTPKKYFYREINKIDENFKSHPNFGGIAVHYLNAFLALK